METSPSSYRRGSVVTLRNPTFYLSLFSFPFSSVTVFLLCLESLSYLPSSVTSLSLFHCRFPFMFSLTLVFVFSSFNWNLSFSLSMEKGTSSPLFESNSKITYTLELLSSTSSFLALQTPNTGDKRTGSSIVPVDASLLTRPCPRSTRTTSKYYRWNPRSSLSTPLCWLS